MKSVAIVTGSSKGLGAELACQLIEHCDLIIACARHHNPHLEHLAKQVGKTLIQYPVDLSQPEQIEAFCQNLHQHLPKQAEQYLLINNAGVLGDMVQYTNAPNSQSISQAFNVNVVSLMRISASVLQIAPNTSDIRILNISSGAARNAYAGWSIYCSSKAAVDMYTKALRIEAPHARISAVAPGIIDTDMQGTIRQSNVKDFPLLDKFINSYEQKQLYSPAFAANKLIQHLLHDDFAHHDLDDIRNY